ncbi:MAG TPA: DUF5615 family PIN-like protein [Anaerolineae bacterium]|nr:DUF5615 family PIN-like protein [Anaerolineae bacterium]
MKLLLDHNLSPRLIQRLADIFPDSTHTHLVNLDRASDRAVWNFARDNGYIIVSKDSDFSDLSMVLGFPPKVVWIRRENCSISAIEKILREGLEAIQKLEYEAESAVLILY